MTETRNYETKQANQEITIRTRVARGKRTTASKLTKRIGRNRYSFTNIHGDYIQRATVTLQGQEITVESFGATSPWYSEIN